MVARLTPDQKAACSSHVGVIILSAKCSFFDWQIMLLIQPIDFTFYLCRLVSLDCIEKFSHAVRHQIIIIQNSIRRKVSKNAHFLPRPGFEPGLLRPQRRVLTTRRSRLDIEAIQLMLELSMWLLNFTILHRLSLLTTPSDDLQDFSSSCGKERLNP